ncbi:MAG: hypothetical protein R3F54_28790 [Alphaproteobacteria bacterium]
MKGIYLMVMLVDQDGLPRDDVIREGRVLVGHNGALHLARIHRTMHNPFHLGKEVWQTAGGTYLYNVRSYVELSEPLPAHALV